MASCLLQSKSYLTIISIPYIKENTNSSINSTDIEKIIQFTHIFNNVYLALKLCIIKSSPKSDMVVIQINIWDVQSSTKAKSLINRCFNIGNYIATVRGANMNSGISVRIARSGDTTFVCHAQKLRCVKCNGLYKVKHYRYFAWCCKANFKINLPQLKMKQGKPYSHSFKCLNCKGNHQANSNTCLFWRHYFNKKWHTKKYQEL